MSQPQRGFVFMPDGFWYAPPIDPADDLDYQITAPLDAGDAIAGSVSWSITGSGLVTHDPSNTTTTMKVWLKSGVDGTTYTVTAAYTTTGGRHFERSFKIKCQQR